jgi:alpha-amylase
MLKRLMLSIAIVFSIFSFQHASAGVLMQGFFWDAPSDGNHAWWDLLSSRASDLAKAGFTAVWIPPELKGASGGLSGGYDPFDDYDLGSKDQRGSLPTHWGSREQLMRSVAVMRANGLEVYADLVLMHRNGDSGDLVFKYRGSLGNVSGRFEKGPSDFVNDSSGFGRNLNHMKPEVRERLKQAGDWLIKATGVQGQRIDYAIKVPTPFLVDYLNAPSFNGKFTVVEYWDENVDVLEDYIHNRMQGKVAAFDFPLWGKLKNMSNGKGFFNMRELAKAGLAGRDPSRAVTFVENHDTDKAYPTLANKHLGYAYILTSEGYPTVFWRDYYDYGMQKVIDPLVWIHEHLASGSTEIRWADDDLLVYERQGGKKLFVGINDNASTERKETVQTGFGGGVKLHDYAGNKPDIETGSDGKVVLTVGANSYVAYAPLGQDGTNRTSSYDVTQEFAGAADLDIAPAIVKEQIVGRIYVRGGTEPHLNLFFNDKGGAQVRLKVIDPLGKSVVDGTAQVASDGDFQAAQSGMYTVSVQAVPKAARALAADFSIPFWLKVTYRAPEK